MAITINLTNIAVDLTTGIGTIIDGSTYTSPSRATCGVFLKVYKTDYNGNKSVLETTASPIDPNTTSQWTYPHTADGWHQIAYVAPPDYAGGTTYARYDAVFDPSGLGVYRSKSNGNIGNALNNTTFWEPISDPSGLAFNVGTATESVNLTTLTAQTVYNIVLYPITQKEWLDETGESFLEASSDYKRPQDVRRVHLLQIATFSMDLANNRQEYSEGEIFARRAAYLINHEA